METNTRAKIDNAVRNESLMARWRKRYAGTFVLMAIAVIGFGCHPTREARKARSPPSSPKMGNGGWYGISHTLRRQETKIAEPRRSQQSFAFGDIPPRRSRSEHRSELATGGCRRARWRRMRAAWAYSRTFSTAR